MMVMCVCRTYQSLSVSGSAAVQFFLTKSLVTNTRDAVLLGNMLLKNGLLVAGTHKLPPNSPLLQSASLNGGDASSAATTTTTTSYVLTDYPFRNAELTYHLVGAVFETHVHSERAKELAQQKAEQMAAAAAAHARTLSATPPVSAEITTPLNGTAQTYAQPTTPSASASASTALAATTNPSSHHPQPHSTPNHNNTLSTPSTSAGVKVSFSSTTSTPLLSMTHPSTNQLQAGSPASVPPGGGVAPPPLPLQPQPQE